MSRKIIEASEGMVLTDGETYGTKIYLAEGVTSEVFYEITKEEYDKILEAENSLRLSEGGSIDG